MLIWCDPAGNIEVQQVSKPVNHVHTVTVRLAAVYINTIEEEVGSTGKKEIYSVNIALTPVLYKILIFIQSG